MKFEDVDCILPRDTQPVTMSNKEAIRRIRDHMCVHGISEPHAYYINIALNKAIVALAQIDEAREVVIDLLNQFAYTGQKDGRAMIWTGGLSVLESGFGFVGGTTPILRQNQSAIMKDVMNLRLLVRQRLWGTNGFAQSTIKS